jgi:hypothetical protein
VGVVAGQAQHVAIGQPRRRHEEVAVGDPAGQRDEAELAVAELRDPPKRRGELLAQLAS